MATKSDFNDNDIFIICDSNVNPAIGKRLKEERVKKNLTQRQLADKIGISQQSIAAYERGYHNISRAMITKICKALEIDSNTFKDTMLLGDLKKDSSLGEVLYDINKIYNEMQLLSNAKEDSALFSYLEDTYTEMISLLSNAFKPYTPNLETFVVRNKDINKEDFQKLIEIFRQLNNIGRQEALKRLGEMFYIPTYTDET